MKLFNAIAAAAVIGGTFIAVPPSASAKAANSIEWNDQSRLATINCGGLGTFTLDSNQKPSARDLPSLCSCLTKETNQKGWELAALKKMNAGIDPGFVEKHGAIARFGKAVESCAADKYYLPAAISSSNIDISKEGGQLNTGSQRLLGFLGGGPIGAVIAPLAYNLFGGNLVAWIIAGVIIGGFLWNLTIGLVLVSIGSIQRAFESKNIKK